MCNSVLLDSSARRFQAKRIYLRASAAARWINTRNALPQAQVSDEQQAATLEVQQQEIDNTLDQVSAVSCYSRTGRQAQPTHPGVSLTILAYVSLAPFRPFQAILAPIDKMAFRASVFKVA